MGGLLRRHGNNLGPPEMPRRWTEAMAVMHDGAVRVATVTFKPRQQDYFE
jgi:hypothetical protein